GSLRRRLRKISHQLLAVVIGMTWNGSHPSSSLLRNPSCVEASAYVGTSIHENSQRSGPLSITISLGAFSVSPHCHALSLTCPRSRSHATRASRTHFISRAKLDFCPFLRTW